MKHIRSLFGWATEWTWWPLMVKVAGWSVAFLALAHVGRGAAAGLTASPKAAGHVRVAESAEARATPSASSSCTPTSAAWMSDGKLILNTATAVDLDKLPGIGKKRAEAIVALRTKLGGRFRSVRDLRRIRGIGPRAFKNLEPLLVLDAPVTPAASPTGSGQSTPGP